MSDDEWVLVYSTKIHQPDIRERVLDRNLERKHGLNGRKKLDELRKKRDLRRKQLLQPENINEDPVIHKIGNEIIQVFWWGLRADRLIW